MKNVLLAFSAGALVAAGCGKVSLTANSSHPGPTVDTTPRSPAESLDHPPMTAPQPITSANPQRLTVSQVRGAVPVALGNDLNGNPIAWRYPGGQPGLTVVAGTLGEPDYVQTTEEDLSASPLYLKFMDDLARDTCDQALTADYRRSQSSQRAIIRYLDLADTESTNAAGMNENLRYLKLRFHAVKVADDDDGPIAPLRDLFARALRGSAGGAAPTARDVKEGWRAVCIALLTAPEFHIY